MSTAFYDVLRAELKNSAGRHRDLSVHVTVEVDFASGPIRLWGGVGEMQTPDGTLWTGFYNKTGKAGELTSAIGLPDQIDDVRSGFAVPHGFELGFIDEKRWSKLRDDDQEIAGRRIVMGYVVMPKGGLNTLSYIGHKTKLTITGSPSWSEKRRRTKTGGVRIFKSAALKATGPNAGRSVMGGLRLTETNQIFRSKELYDVDGDVYAGFMGIIASGLDLRF